MDGMGYHVEWDKSSLKSQIKRFHHVESRCKMMQTIMIIIKYDNN
jgi:hypothetical protein